MKMLRWMSDHTTQISLRNTIIRVKIGVTPIVEKMVEPHLRWFGHVWGKTHTSTDKEG